jgi:hypothetical protein
MLFVELAAQAVRGFTPSVRVALKAGFVGLRSPTEVPAPLSGLVTALCFPDGRGGDLAFLAPGAKVGRAGLAIQGKGQITWRVMRDLGGAGGVHRLNPRTNQYELITQSATEVAQVIRTEVGFPTRGVFEQIFSFSGAQLPSRRPQKPKPVASSPGPRSTGPSGPELREIHGRIAAFEHELESAKKAAELQFKADGLQAELFNAEAALKDLEELRGRVAAAREALDQAPSPKTLGLPEDIVQRVRRYNEDKKRRDEAISKLQTEKEQAVDPVAFAVPPLHRDRRFWGALLAGVGLLGLGAALEGGARYVALLAIPAFTVATLFALRFIEDLQRKSREEAKADVFAQREKKIADEFHLSTVMVRTAYDKTDTESPDDFAAAMARRDELAPALMELEIKLAEVEADPANVELPAKIGRTKLEIEELNQQLLEFSGGYVREVREIEREISELKEMIAPRPPAIQSPSAVTPPPVEVFDDPVPPLMQLGAELFNTDVITLWSVLKDRVVQYLKALTDQRYQDIDVVADGRARVMAQGRVIPATELPAGDIDLLYLSLRLTLVEKYAAQEKVPLVVEDSFGTIIDPGKQNLLGRMLKHLGSMTQVLFVVGADQTPAAVDSLVQL